MINTCLNVAIAAIPTAMVLHLAVCFVAKYGIWQRQGRTFHPSALTPAPSSESVEAAPTVQVLPPDNARQRLQSFTIRQLREAAIDLNQRLGQRHPNRVRKVARLPKAELIDALLPRYAGLVLPA